MHMGDLKVSPCAPGPKVPVKKKKKVNFRGFYNFGQNNGGPVIKCAVGFENLMSTAERALICVGGFIFMLSGFVYKLFGIWGSKFQPNTSIRIIVQYL